MEKIHTYAFSTRKVGHYRLSHVDKIIECANLSYFEGEPASPMLQYSFQSIMRMIYVDK